jgi:hypothetical protein
VGAFEGLREDPAGVGTCDDDALRYEGARDFAAVEVFFTGLSRLVSIAFFRTAVFGAVGAMVIVVLGFTLSIPCNTMYA